MNAPVTTIGRGRLRTVGTVLALLIAIVLAFFAIRLSVDVPNLAAGTVPEDAYDRRFVEHPWLAYLHIVPGVLYLLGAPLQLSRRFRTRHYTVHRRLGRVLLSLALLSGVFAIAFGVPFAFGGPWEAAATLVFGVWFLACLVLAFRAIRRDEVARHRRWMIRAFAIGVGVGTIRICSACSRRPGCSRSRTRSRSRSGSRSPCTPRRRSGGSGARPRSPADRPNWVRAAPTSRMRAKYMRNAHAVQTVARPAIAARTGLVGSVSGQVSTAGGAYTKRGQPEAPGRRGHVGEAAGDEQRSHGIADRCQQHLDDRPRVAGARPGPRSQVTPASRRRGRSTGWR